MTNSSPYRNQSAALRAAILIWKRDEPISVHLYARLLAEGFDADTLEQLYRP